MIIWQLTVIIWQNSEIWSNLKQKFRNSSRNSDVGAAGVIYLQNDIDVWPCHSHSNVTDTKEAWHVQPQYMMLGRVCREWLLVSESMTEQKLMERYKERQHCDYFIFKQSEIDFQGSWKDSGPRSSNCLLLHCQTAYLSV